MKDFLFFLVKFYLKLILSYTSKVGYYKVDFCNNDQRLC